MRHWRQAISLLLCAGASGCFLTNAPEDGSVLDGSSSDGGPRDAQVHGDSDRPVDGSIIVDGDACPVLGSTRVCGPECPGSCERVEACTTERFFFCYGGDTDPRGPDEFCAVSLQGGLRYCYRGTLCATHDDLMRSEESWSGLCVDPEYCRWALEHPELDGVHCRYSDSTVFREGPPDEPCGEGAHERGPFCGGRCGDTCPASSLGLPYACVGVNERRGFGVCVPSPFPGCTIEELMLSDAPLDDCERAGGAECVCMILGPALAPEYADSGWGVAEQSCLAYQAHYPDQVRCVDRGGREL